MLGRDPCALLRPRGHTVTFSPILVLASINYVEESADRGGITDESHCTSIVVLFNGLD